MGPTLDSGMYTKICRFTYIMAIAFVSNFIFSSTQETYCVVSRPPVIAGISAIKNSIRGAFSFLCPVAVKATNTATIFVE